MEKGGRKKGGGGGGTGRTLHSFELTSLLPAMATKPPPLNQQIKRKKGRRRGTAASSLPRSSLEPSFSGICREDASPTP